MQPLPHTISELETLLPTEDACREFLAQLRWPNGFNCPNCRHEGVWHTSRGRMICRKCRYQASVTAGTIFQDSHKPLQMSFRAIWYVASQETASSATGLQKFLDLGSYRLPKKSPAGSREVVGAEAADCSEDLVDTRAPTRPQCRGGSVFSHPRPSQAVP
ncbi:MAG: transposase [Rhodopirellula sp.]|nr:transposase [Rhodopirellula sp.]